MLIFSLGAQSGMLPSNTSSITGSTLIFMGGNASKLMLLLSPIGKTRSAINPGGSKFPVVVVVVVFDSNDVPRDAEVNELAHTGYSFFATVVRSPIHAVTLTAGLSFVMFVRATPRPSIVFWVFARSFLMTSVVVVTLSTSLVCCLATVLP